MSAVSIIVPAHNPGSYLREALASVRAQSFDDWELIVVDDHSSQDLSWVVQEFPGVRYLRQQHGGASVARNNGILNADSGLIAFMDQDDLWRPGKLQRAVAAMRRHPDAAVCYCDLRMIKADDSLASVETESVADVEPVVELDGAVLGTEGCSGVLGSLRYFSQRFVVPSTVLIRRSCLATSGLLDPFIPFSGDFDLLVKLGAKHKVIRVPTADVLYRKHANNFSDQYEVGRGEVKALVARYVAYAEATGDRHLADEAAGLFRRPRRLYATQAFDRARLSFRQRRYRQLARHWVRAVMFSPSYTLGSSARWAVSAATGRNAT